MKHFMLTLTAIFAASAAIAQGLMGADADGNGTLSLTELQAAIPELTAEQFAAIDADGNGEASAEEIDAAIQAGVVGQ